MLATTAAPARYYLVKSANVIRMQMYIGKVLPFDTLFLHVILYGVSGNSLGGIGALLLQGYRRISNAEVNSMAAGDHLSRSNGTNRYVGVVELGVILMARGIHISSYLLLKRRIFALL